MRENPLKSSVKPGLYKVEDKTYQVLRNGGTGEVHAVLPNFDRRTKTQLMTKPGMKFYVNFQHFETPMSSRQFVRFRKEMKRMGKW